MWFNFVCNWYNVTENYENRRNRLTEIESSRFFIFKLTWKKTFSLPSLPALIYRQVLILHHHIDNFQIKRNSIVLFPMNWQFARRFILQPCLFCIKWLLRQEELLSKALIEITHLFVYSQRFVTLIPLAIQSVWLFVSGSALYFALWFILTH